MFRAVGSTGPGPGGIGLRGHGRRVRRDRWRFGPGRKSERLGHAAGLRGQGQAQNQNRPPRRPPLLRALTRPWVRYSSFSARWPRSFSEPHDSLSGGARRGPDAGRSSIGPHWRRVFAGVAALPRRGIREGPMLSAFQARGRRPAWSDARGRRALGFVFFRRRGSCARDGFVIPAVPRVSCGSFSRRGWVS
jgi:hypothetical protein